MGGVIASSYSKLYPNEIASLTLLAPAGLIDLGPVETVRKSGRAVKWLIRHLLNQFKVNAWKDDFINKKGIYKERLNDYINQLNLIHKTNPKAQDAFWHSVLQFPLSGIDETVTAIADTSIPIHILWGKLDKAVPYDPNYYRWHNYLSDRKNGRTSFTTYDKLAHGFFIEEPDQSNESILEFLKTLL
eukprot:gene20518-26613_t